MTANSPLPSHNAPSQTSTTNGNTTEDESQSRHERKRTSFLLYFIFSALTSTGIVFGTSYGRNVVEGSTYAPLWAYILTILTFVELFLWISWIIYDENLPGNSSPDDWFWKCLFWIFLRIVLSVMHLIFFAVCTKFDAAPNVWALYVATTSCSDVAYVLSGPATLRKG